MATFIERPTLHPRGFRDNVRLPYGLRVAEIKAALDDIYDFLHSVNRFLVNRGWDRLEETLAAATFSGIMSELVVEGISKRSVAVVKNRYHNGRPDLLPAGLYPNDAAQRADEGIEVKASRNAGGWQGHNVEPGWLMVVQYVVDTDTEPVEERSPTTIVRVLAARLDERDWGFSGRAETSRRTPTASILKSGTAKLEAGVVYLDPSLAGRSRAADPKTWKR